MTRVEAGVGVRRCIDALRLARPRLGRGRRAERSRAPRTRPRSMRSPRRAGCIRARVAARSRAVGGVPRRQLGVRQRLPRPSAAGRRLARVERADPRAARRRSHRARRRRRPRSVADACPRHGRSDRAAARRRDRLSARGRGRRRAHGRSPTSSAAATSRRRPRPRSCCSACSGLPTPRYRHHFLLLEPDGDKLAKLHGSIPFTLLENRYRGDELCALLAGSLGLRSSPARDLVADFDWHDVATIDRVATWTDDGLSITS